MHTLHIKALNHDSEFNFLRSQILDQISHDSYDSCRGLTESYPFRVHKTGQVTASPVIVGRKRKRSSNISVKGLLWTIRRLSAGRDSLEPLIPWSTYSAAMVQPRGGKATAKKRTPEERAEAARKAVLARWKERPSIQAETKVITPRY